MQLRGKLIKKTTEITYNRQTNNSPKFMDNLDCLSKLVYQSQATAFGKTYDFPAILNQEDFVASFQKKVPLFDYNTFHDQWLARSLNGEPNVILPGKINHFALTSGTTGAPSKKIPVSHEMIKYFQKTSVRQLSTLHELNLSASFYNAQILVVGGSSKLVKMPTHYEGDLSGILKKYTTVLAAPFTKPGRKIAGIKNWNEKLEKMVEKAPEWNIGIMAGVPSWCIMLIEKIVERYQLNSIHDIWPNFEVYVHGGVFMTPYLSRFEKITGKKVHLLDTYLASEGYFAYQFSSSDKGMKLLLDNGIFFEFIPFDEQHFDPQGNIIDPHKALLLNQVEANKPYAMVITTNSGLYRYVLGDVIQFYNVETYEMRITGRIKQFMSLVGEHISLDNINVGIEYLCHKYNINISEFCVYANPKEMRHEWFIGTNDEVNPEELLKELDQHLAINNDDYASVRKYTLNHPTIKKYPTEVFYDFMKSIGKFGSQSKFPRVLNKHQEEQWLNFLKEQGLF